MSTVLLYFVSGLQKRHDLAQFAHAENAANLETLDGSADITDTAEGNAALLIDTSESVSGLRLGTFNLPEG